MCKYTTLSKFLCLLHGMDLFNEYCYLDEYCECCRMDIHDCNNENSFYVVRSGSNGVFIGMSDDQGEPSITYAAGLESASFKYLWSKFKKHMDEIDLELFYEIVDIEGTYGRRLLPTMHDYNPRYNSHWFAIGRCHWNVILPCFIMNDGQLDGRCKIITSDEHSVLFDTQTGRIYDPTYEFHGMKMESHPFELSDKHAIYSLDEHIKSLNDPVSVRWEEFKKKHLS